MQEMFQDFDPYSLGSWGSAGLDVLDLPGALARGLLAGRPGERYSGEELANAYGWEDPGALGSTALSMATDPLSYLAMIGPAARMLRGAGGAARAAGAARAVSEAAHATPFLKSAAFGFGAPLAGAAVMDANKPYGNPMADALAMGLMVSPMAVHAPGIIAGAGRKLAGLAGYGGAAEATHGVAPLEETLANWRAQHLAKARQAGLPEDQITEMMHNIEQQHASMLDTQARAQMAHDIGLKTGIMPRMNGSDSFGDPFGDASPTQTFQQRPYIGNDAITTQHQPSHGFSPDEHAAHAELMDRMQPSVNQPMGGAMDLPSPLSQQPHFLNEMQGNGGFGGYGNPAFYDPNSGLPNWGSKYNENAGIPQRLRGGLGENMPMATGGSEFPYMSSNPDDIRMRNISRRGPLSESEAMFSEHPEMDVAPNPMMSNLSPYEIAARKQQGIAEHAASAIPQPIETSSGGGMGGGGNAFYDENPPMNINSLMERMDNQNAVSFRHEPRATGEPEPVMGGVSRPNVDPAIETARKYATALYQNPDKVRELGYTGELKDFFGSLSKVINDKDMPRVQKFLDLVDTKLGKKSAPSQAVAASPAVPRGALDAEAQQLIQGLKADALERQQMEAALETRKSDRPREPILEPMQLRAGERPALTNLDLAQLGMSGDPNVTANAPNMADWLTQLSIERSIKENPALQGSDVVMQRAARNDLGIPSAGEHETRWKSKGSKKWNKPEGEKVAPPVTSDEAAIGQGMPINPKLLYQGAEQRAQQLAESVRKYGTHDISSPKTGTQSIQEFLDSQPYEMGSQDLATPEIVQLLEQSANLPLAENEPISRYFGTAPLTNPASKLKAPARSLAEQILMDASAPGWYPNTPAPNVVAPNPNVITNLPKPGGENAPIGKKIQPSQQHVPSQLQLAKQYLAALELDDSLAAKAGYTKDPELLKNAARTAISSGDPQKFNKWFESKLPDESRDALNMAREIEPPLSLRNKKGSPTPRLEAGFTNVEVANAAKAAKMAAEIEDIAKGWFFKGYPEAFQGDIPAIKEAMDAGNFDLAHELMAPARMGMSTDPDALKKIDDLHKQAAEATTMKPVEKKMPDEFYDLERALSENRSLRAGRLKKAARSQLTREAAELEGKMKQMREEALASPESAKTDPLTLAQQIFEGLPTDEQGFWHRNFSIKDAVASDVNRNQLTFQNINAITEHPELLKQIGYKGDPQDVINNLTDVFTSGKAGAMEDANKWLKPVTGSTIAPEDMDQVAEAIQKASRSQIENLNSQTTGTSPYLNIEREHIAAKNRLKELNDQFKEAKKVAGKKNLIVEEQRDFFHLKKEREQLIREEAALRRELNKITPTAFRKPEFPEDLRGIPGGEHHGFAVDEYNTNLPGQLGKQQFYESISGDPDAVGGRTSKVSGQDYVAGENKDFGERVAKGSADRAIEESRYGLDKETWREPISKEPDASDVAAAKEMAEKLGTVARSKIPLAKPQATVTIGGIPGGLYRILKENKQVSALVNALGITDPKMILMLLAGGGGAALAQALAGREYAGQGA